MFSTVGAVIASRRPGNPIGWILCAAGLVAAVCLAGATLVALSPGKIAGLGPITNPLGIGALGGMKTDSWYRRS